MSRQEPYRVYLQQYVKDEEVKTISAAIRLTPVTSAGEVCSLLRQKFGLQALSQSSVNSRVGTYTTHGKSSQPLVDRIHARLNQVRRSSNLAAASKTTNDNINNDENRTLRRKKRSKKLLEIQSTGDTLVMVATCYVPNDYVQYEHEHGNTYQTEKNTKTVALKKAPNSPNHTDMSPGLFNIIETLLPYEIPLQKKDELIESIQSRSNITGKPPLIRLFFVPNQINVRSTIVMDGYCTDLDDDSDDSDSDLDQNQFMKQKDQVSERISWQDDVEDYRTTALSQDQIRLHKQRHHFTILSSFESANGYENPSGYLLKQSRKDKNVWKRVYCVLTENQFWCVTRVKRICKHGSRIGKHGIMDLNGSLFLELALDSLSSSLPNTFQLTTKDGKVHVFQAGKKSAYLRWSQCISERILLCQENSTFVMTDYVISKGTQARQATYTQFLTSSFKYLSNDVPSMEQIRKKDDFKLLIQFGIRIADYKVLCKHAHLQFSLITNARSRMNQNSVSTERHNMYEKIKAEWLQQSFVTMKVAESLLKKCCDIISLLEKSSRNGNLDRGLGKHILDIQNAIRLCIQNFKQEPKNAIQVGNEFNSERQVKENYALQRLLLPEALFDQIYYLLIQ